MAVALVPGIVWAPSKLKDARRCSNDGYQFVEPWIVFHWEVIPELEGQLRLALIATTWLSPRISTNGNLAEEIDALTMAGRHWLPLFTNRRNRLNTIQEPIQEPIQAAIN